MARVTSFFRDSRNGSRHPTEVECGWQFVRTDRGRLLQLATFGSDQRASEKKVSQTIQLDEAAARELLGLLGEFLGVDAAGGGSAPR